MALGFKTERKEEVEGEAVSFEKQGFWGHMLSLSRKTFMVLYSDVLIKSDGWSRREWYKTER